MCPTCGFYEDVDCIAVDDAKGVGFVCDICISEFNDRVKAATALFMAEIARDIYNGMVNEYQAEIDKAHEESFYNEDTYVDGDGE